MEHSLSKWGKVQIQSLRGSWYSDNGKIIKEKKYDERDTSSNILSIHTIRMVMNLLQIIYYNKGKLNRRIEVDYNENSLIIEKRIYNSAEKITSKKILEFNYE